MEIIFHFIDINFDEISVHRLELPPNRFFAAIAEFYPLSIIRQFNNCVAWRTEIVPLK